MGVLDRRLRRTSGPQQPSKGRQSVRSAPIPDTLNVTSGQERPTSLTLRCVRDCFCDCFCDEQADVPFFDLSIVRRASTRRGLRMHEQVTHHD